MADSLFTSPDEGSFYFSRTDTEQIFGAWSRHGFSLEDKDWPSVEHYFQAMKFNDPAYQEKIRQAPHPRDARKLGRTRFKRIRKDWKDAKLVFMTRALYTKCKTHPEIADALLKTGDQKLVENSVYDYFWGCGRDRRGKNMYGQVLMNIRNKLLEESATQSGNQSRPY